MNIAQKYMYAACALLSLSASSLATAQMTVSYPGTMCRPDGHNPEYGHYTNLGQVRNYHTESIGFICPVPQHGGRVLRAFVFAKDASPLENVECRVQSKDSSGVVGWWSSKVGSAGTDDNYKINLGSLPGFNDPGIKFFQCRIPAPVGGKSSGINSYTVVEE